MGQSSPESGGHKPRLPYEKKRSWNIYIYNQIISIDTRNIDIYTRKIIIDIVKIGSDREKMSWCNEKRMCYIEQIHIDFERSALDMKKTI